MNIDGIGFHVIYKQKFQELPAHALPEIVKEQSVLEFLRGLTNKNIPRFNILTGLDSFLGSSGEEVVNQVRVSLNNALKYIIEFNAVIVFVVNSLFENFPDNPSINKVPLARIFPKPLDMASIEPGYLFYRII